MANLRIELGLFASLQKWQSHVPATLEIPEGSCIRTMLALLAIPESEVAIVFHNGKRATLDTCPGDGDAIKLFPLIGGG
jgi:sulfur carrier protein ThiS